MRKILSFIVCLFLNLCFIYGFSERDIISPVSGTWNNVQPLVLNVEDGTEIYYSITGTDPLRFGFAYDGPIVLRQKGNVSLAITAVDEKGERKDFTVAYTVKDAAVAGTENIAAFVQDIIAHPLKRYVSGSVFSIPEHFNYYIDETGERIFSGTDLHISEKNNVERFVPFTVTDGSLYLHFVLQIVPQQNSILHSKKLPFSIDNWNIISFSSAKYVYSVDDGAWSSDLTAFLLDRLTVHTIRWKTNADSDSDEEIFSYTLPPMPQLVSSVEPYGQVTFSLMPAPNDIGNSMNYKIGKVPQNLSLIRIADGLYDSITIDAFSGEELTSSFFAGVYYDGVYQGALQQQVIVDRLPPLPPVLSASQKKHTVLCADAEEGAVIFYSVSDPIEFDAEDIASMEPRFADARTGEFFEFSKGKITLSSVSEQPTFYKVQAYAVDRAGNKSELSELRIVADEYNIYVNPLSLTSDERDGSYVHPFSTLEEAVAAMNGMPHKRLHIIGNISVQAPVSITTDCDIVGKNSSLLFSERAYLSVQKASVSIKNCALSKKSFDKDDRQFITVATGSLLFEDCQISGLFASDGTLVQSFSSALAFDNASLTIHASSYSCNIKAVDSSITATDVRVVAVGHTCVNVSLSNSSCAMSGGVTDISAHIGRSFECVMSHIELEHNTFKASLDASLKRQGLEAVWKDADTIDYSHDNAVLYGDCKGR
ncbi:MAG: chitobiase/beta-hexosaminidase C-terminal domain-containing protein [Treponema sp.]|nr:chitobiase/beta-hexosaminidase C-terminal domain-containing protein [Treponema sp.]